jgi:2-polyprenyl-3-methyl-5-hydroxy-6-metoxy-1,4-benzoquinol methylase
MTTERQTSRISDGKLMELFSLGEFYLSDFVDAPVADGEKVPLTDGEKVPLTLALDEQSGLLELKHTASLDTMYREYWYRSGINKTMVEELRGIARKALTLLRCEKGDIVLDIGANDGTLLRFYDHELYRVGFDPARNLKKYAEKHADLVVDDFFSASAYFDRLNRKAKIVTTLAMFYDLEDPHSFVEDINAVLDAEGLWIIQMSYMPLMLKQMAFDNICHEHLEYYSLSTLDYLTKQHNLKIVDVELNDINGGSFRIYLRKCGSDDNLFATAPYRDVAQFRIDSIFAYEKSLNLSNPDTYTTWFQKISELKKKTVDFVKSEKAAGKTIWGYGASTKGNTLLQWYGLDSTLIDAIAERNPDKYGKLTVGTNIPIKSEKEMRVAKPDYLLILPWHFVSAFQNREREYLQSGGKFIVPCPKFEVITG